MKLDMVLSRGGAEKVGQPIEVDQDNTDPSGGWVFQARDAAWQMLLFYGSGSVTVWEVDEKFRHTSRVLTLSYEVHDE